MSISLADFKDAIDSASWPKRAKPENGEGYRAAGGRWIATGDSALMTMFDWEGLVASVRLGDFAIPITVRMDHEVMGDTLLFDFSFRTKDVKGGFPTTIASKRRLACGDALSMSRGVADDFLRREIREIVLHELAEFLVIGGRREDPHADENRYPAEGLSTLSGKDPRP